MFNVARQFPKFMPYKPAFPQPADVRLAILDQFNGTNAAELAARYRTPEQVVTDLIRCSLRHYLLLTEAAAPVEPPERPAHAPRTLKERLHDQCPLCHKHRARG